MPGRMAGRVALITGGGGGIGEATARLFAEEGGAVALVDTDRDAVGAAATGIIGLVSGDGILPLVADLAQESEAQRVVDETVSRFGGLHTLVNVAGVRLYTPLAEAEAKEWELIFSVNVLGAAFCAKAAIPHLRAARALKQAGFRVVRESKHIVMTDGRIVVTIPRHDPVNANTMAVIVRDAGLTPKEFRDLL